MRYLSFLLLVLASFCAKGQSPKLKIRNLIGDLYVYTTYNTYMGALIDANAMFLVTEKGVVVIDAPWDPAQFQPFLDTIEARHNKKVVLAIATHSHDDRAGGLGFFKSRGIRTYASKMTNEILESKKKPQAAFTFTDDTTFTVGQYKISTFYAGEGHTKDNLVIWFPKDKILFGGCLIKSTQAKDLGNITEANLSEWPKSIQKLKRRFPLTNRVVTGHQAWGNRESLDYTQKLLLKQ